jgi:hypothetical protein
VVRLRGLAELRPIETRTVDTATFDAIFAAKVKREERPKDAARGIQRPPENYLGFYDQFSKVIVLRKQLPKWASDAGVQPTDLLAHEVVHALQDQHFGIPDTSKIDDDDRLLAVQALYEGDAQLLMEAYHAKMHHQSWRHAALYAFEQGGIAADVGIRSGLFSPSLLDLPSARREAVAFPYLSGIAFASALFRSGGFALIDRAFVHPPQTTADILEPARYLAGESSAPIDTLPIPAGAVARIDTPVGEFGLGVLLTNLLSAAKEKEARLAVLGWNGARLTEFVAPNGAGTLLATEWKSDRDARRFELALRHAVETRGLAGSPASDLAAVEGDGTSVAFVLTPGASGFTRRLLHVARSPPPGAPPLGAVVLTAEPVPLTARMPLRGGVTAARYWSPWLGLRSIVPAGFASDTRRPEAQLLIARQAPSTAVGLFTVYATSFTAVEREQLHKSFIESLVGSVDKATRPVPLASGPGETPLGVGTETTWRVSIGGQRMFARSLVVAVCDGQAVLQWGTLWADNDGGNALESWIRSFESTSRDTAPACEDFRNEMAEDDTP